MKQYGILAIKARPGTAEGEVTHITTSEDVTRKAYDKLPALKTKMVTRESEADDWVPFTISVWHR